MQVTIGTGDVYVAHWNGSSWIRDGGALNVSSSSVAGFPSIASVSGVAYVAWSEQAAGQPEQVYVAHWSGSAWVDDGGSLNASATDNARTPSIVGIGTVPYVAWAEDNGSGGAALFVAHFSAGSWTEDVDGYTNPESTSPLVSHPAVADVGGVPSVAFQERVTRCGTMSMAATSRGVGYSWRAYATDGAVDTAFGPTHTFTTEATSTTGPKGKAGKIEVVTCRQTHFHGVTVEQCTGKLVSAPVEVAAEQIHAGRLSRGQRLYATVEVLRGRNGRMRLLIVHRVRRLSRGSYTLRTRAGRTTVRLS